MHFFIDAEAVRDELMEYYTEATNLRARIQLSMQQRSEVHEELHRSARRDVQVNEFINTCLSQLE